MRVKTGRLTVPCDDLSSFIYHKGNWNSLLGVYRQCAVFYNDDWDVYKSVLPQTRHRVVGQKRGQTNHVEQFNNTLPQRVSRVVRCDLALSESLGNHIGLLWNFIHHYNVSLPVQHYQIP